jgi:Tat protein translocase TatB subunit
MFGIGFWELVIIFMVALIVLGPKRLPEVAKTLGRFYREIMGVVNEVKSSVNEPVKDIPKNYIPPTLDDSSIKDENRNENIDTKNYEPKREKISFKKKIEEKDDTKDKQS